MNTNAFSFDGRSRVNKMSLARDHKQSRSAVLDEAQRRRKRREEEQKRNDSAIKIQKKARSYLAKSTFVLVALEELEQGLKTLLRATTNTTPSASASVGVVSSSSPSNHNNLHNNTKRIVPFLERLCWCLDSIKQNRKFMPSSVFAQGENSERVQYILGNKNAYQIFLHNMNRLHNNNNSNTELTFKVFNELKQSEKVNLLIQCLEESLYKLEYEQFFISNHTTQNEEKKNDDDDVVAAIFNSEKILSHLFESLLNSLQISVQRTSTNNTTAGEHGTKIENEEDETDEIEGDDTSHTFPNRITTNTNNNVEMILEMLIRISNEFVHYAANTARNMLSDENEKRHGMSGGTIALKLWCLCLKYNTSFLLQQNIRSQDASSSNNKNISNNDNETLSTVLLSMAESFTGCFETDLFHILNASRNLSILFNDVCWKALWFKQKSSSTRTTRVQTTTNNNTNNISENTNGNYLKLSSNINVTLFSATANSNEDNHTHLNLLSAVVRIAHSRCGCVGARLTTSLSQKDESNNNSNNNNNINTMNFNWDAFTSESSAPSIPNNKVLTLIFGRLTRLLPFFIHLTADVKQLDNVKSDTCNVLLLWLETLSTLAQYVCGSGKFLDNLLFDLHYSSANEGKNGSDTQNHNNNPATITTTAADGESHRGRYRYLISYLYSSEGGLLLLDHLLKAAFNTKDDAGAVDVPGIALEYFCGVLAWPLFIFSTQETQNKDARGIILKFAFTPGLLRQLWKLYARRCRGLAEIMATSATLTQCVSDWKMQDSARMPTWEEPTPAVLAAHHCSELHLKRHLSYDPCPCLSVLFFTLFNAYVGATNFAQSIREKTVFDEEECFAFVVSLKEIVHRSHFYGVVPHSNSEAVAHIAFLLLSKLHIVNEATNFLPLNAAWVSEVNPLVLRGLDEITLRSWDDFEIEHFFELKYGVNAETVEKRNLHNNDSSSSDEEGDLHAGNNQSTMMPGKDRTAAATTTTKEVSSVEQRRSLPGDDSLFTNSYDWPPEERLIRLLLRIPFLISFERRAALLTNFLRQSEPVRVPGPGGNLVVHRGRTLVDTYEKFKDCPSSVDMFGVRFADRKGQLEEGFGQGVYRELLVSICSEGLSAEHGLFRLTEEGYVYPNPFSLEATGDEDHLGKIKFLGAMVGRALRDGILQEVPFALHFRNALLGRKNTINNLKSFDPQLYQQLLSILSLSGEELSQMELTFTYADNGLGITHEHELIKDGSNIKVNSKNRLYYIDLVADYKLNREGAIQTSAFQAGLESIIMRSWLRLFDSIELFKLFGGDSSSSFDIADWKAHTVYNKPEDAEHVSVKLFWEVVETFTKEQQSALLKFATSMRRPPLLGFQFLSPPFKIYLLHNVSEAHLPTASTCFSTLKLPAYKDYGTARDKILAAITESNTFEMS